MPDGDLYATFRPRFALIAGAVTGTVFVVGCIVVALTGVGPTFRTGERISVVVIGLLGGWLIELLVNTSAVPSPQGLVVSNIVRRRRLDWAEVVAVHFGPNDPWVALDLADGKTLAVMAIQRADGARGTRAANRLVHLVELHGEAPELPPSSSEPPERH
ncbi:PH domain-containing protein [Luteimicrobium xylanilyticum]|uniref:Low molecular weight protein antigen 6 PH domain-containing protein n=1 Tax=Luteimicrobium xylanilyticum TaxID=1133546 RepID=A0A5P9QA33_9MICO|nr:PH domain-containing protein [Luteimicrobium xylanilyticum]QFU98318.1 hypothetical protein KDY119_01830 [Luteimicrobium xylanilyticum]